MTCHYQALHSASDWLKEIFRTAGPIRRIAQIWVVTILGDPGAVSRAGRNDATKVFKHGQKSPWVPTLTRPFPNGQANTGSWLSTKNALYYCAQSANSISWVLFVSSYMTAIDSITAFLAQASKKCTQSGILQFDINSPFQNTVLQSTRKLKTLFRKYKLELTTEFSQCKFNCSYW